LLPLFEQAEKPTKENVLDVNCYVVGESRENSRMLLSASVPLTPTTPEPERGAGTSRESAQLFPAIG
jgi:hypothetical protein